MKVRGTQDIFGDREKLFSMVEASSKEIFSRFLYSRVRFPIIEKTELFERNIATSDIVQKELYTFNDRSGRSISLVPEGTAPAARLLLENSLYNSKVFYISPFFRYDRPQKGRYRQFHQIGAEIVGYDSELADVEAVIVLNEIFKSLNLEVTFNLNFLGSIHVRNVYREYLVEALSKYDLSEELKKKLDTNILKVLDSKEHSFDVKPIEDFLLKSDKLKYDKIVELLESNGIPFIKKNIVRGLDYYTGFVFEAFPNYKNSKALAGGGRYDDLYEEIGKRDLPAVGFGAGIERICEAIEHEVESPPFITVGYFSSALMLDAYSLANKLRANGLRVYFNFKDQKIKKQLSNCNSKYIVILAEEELSRGRYILRDMENSEQVEYSFNDLINFFNSAL